MSFRNTSWLSNSMDPDNAQHFYLNLPSAVDKVYQGNSFSRQIVDALLSSMYIPNSLFLVNSLNINSLLTTGLFFTILGQ